MNARPLISMGMAAGLSACVAAPAPEAAAPAKAGDYAVSQGAAVYPARIGPGTSGHQLTSAGARPVAGQTVTVGALGFDQGRLAKTVAAAACADARGRFQPQAVGRYDRGAWIFEGGCA